MIRVAHAVGRASGRAPAGFLGMKLVIGIVALLVAVPLVFTEQIIRIFITPDDPGYAGIEAGGQFLYIGAVFMIFDGLQATAALARHEGQPGAAVDRGLRYWILGIGGSSALAFITDRAASGCGGASDHFGGCRMPVDLALPSVHAGD